MKTTGRTKMVPKPVKGLTAAQGAGALVGAVFLVIGVLGFIPGITTGLDELTWTRDSGAELFGIFSVCVLLNIIHIIFGVMGLVMAQTFWRSKAYLFFGAVLCLGLWGYGLAVHLDASMNTLTLDSSDNWLHLGLGGVMLVLAFTLAGTKAPAGMTPA